MNFKLRVIVGIIIFFAIIVSVSMLNMHYVDESNKVTSNIIVTKIIIKEDSKFKYDVWGNGYFTVIDTHDRGYYTILGKPFIFKTGAEYNISYFCDKNNIRRIVSINEVSKNIYTCDVGECNNG